MRNLLKWLASAGLLLFILLECGWLWALTVLLFDVLVRGTWQLLRRPGQHGGIT